MANLDVGPTGPRAHRPEDHSAKTTKQPLEQQGEQDQAEKLYGMLPEDNPESAEALFRMGYLRLLRGDFRGGVEAFTACLKKRNSWPQAQLNVGIASWRAGDLVTARRRIRGCPRCKGPAVAAPPYPRDV